jgi:hypothetical protein
LVNNNHMCVRMEREKIDSMISELSAAAKGGAA